MIKIYGRANSINVRKVLWMAEELGLPYTREDWGRGYRPLTDPEFLKLNPFSLVPVIDDDGFLLRESNTIVRYLATKHGRADLYPTDLRTRAEAESWMDWAGTDLANAVRPVFFGLVVKAPGFTEPKQLDTAIAELARFMRGLEQHLASGRPYVAGSSFTVGDIPVGMTVNRWFSLEFKKPDLPELKAYYERLSTRPAYRAHGRNGTP
jgi:glutathione S-transferase